MAIDTIGHVPPFDSVADETKALAIDGGAATWKALDAASISYDDAGIPTLASNDIQAAVDALKAQFKYTTWQANPTYTFPAGVASKIAQGNGLCVSYGTLGALASSTDGETWSPQWSWFNGSTINNVLYANSLWVAVGAAGKISTSANGLDWTAQTSGVATALNYLAFGNGQWVAVGDSGVLLSSPDGVTWTSQTSQFTASNILKVRYLNSVFLAVGAASKLSTSTNGTSWTARTSNMGGASINDVAFGNGAWVLVGDITSATGRIASAAAADVTTWTLRTSNYGNFNCQGVIYDSTNTLFVAFGANTTSVVTSADGTAWAAVAHNMAAIQGAVAYAGSQFVAVGNNKIATSPTGAVWTLKATLTNTNFLGLVYNASTYVASAANGGTGGAVIGTSTDGATWTLCANNAYAVGWTSIAYGAGVYVIVGDPGMCMSSPDAFNWTARQIKCGNGASLLTICQVIYANSLFVAVANDGTISKSSDGATWTQVRSASGVFIDVTYDNGLFVAWGLSGLLCTSSDGTTWTARTSQFGANTISRVRYGNGVWLAAGAAGVMSTSPDGTTWTLVSNSRFGTNAINDTYYAAGTWVAIGAAGVISSSTDNATTWTLRDSHGTNALGVASAANNAITYGNGVFVAIAVAGSNTSVIWSADGATWSNVTSRFGLAATPSGSIIFADGLFVLMGGTSTYISTDGKAWRTTTAQALSGATGLRYLNDRFFQTNASALYINSTLGAL